MRDVHVTAELLDALYSYELPPEVLARLMWDHVQAVCPTCAENIETWQKKRRTRSHDYSAAFEKVVARAKGDEESDGREERQVARELSELLRTPVEEREEKVERATKRFRSPQLALRLLDAAWECRHDDPADMVSLARLAVRVAEKGEAHRHPEILVRAAAHLGNAYRVAGLLREADREFRRMRSLIREHSVVDPLLLAEIDSLEGSLRRDSDDLPEAEKLFSRSLLVYRIRREEREAARVLHMLGYLHYKQERFEDALECFHEELSILDEEEDHEMAALARLSLIIIYTDMGLAGEARELLSASTDALAALPGRTFALRVVWAEGRIARALEEYSLAEEKLREATRGFGRLGIGYDAALVALDLAETYLAQGKRGAVVKLARGTERLLAANDLSREAVAALLLFQNAAEQEILSAAILEQVRRRVRREQEKG